METNEARRVRGGNTSQPPLSRGREEGTRKSFSEPLAQTPAFGQAEPRSPTEQPPAPSAPAASRGRDPDDPASRANFPAGQTGRNQTHPPHRPAVTAAGGASAEHGPKAQLLLRSSQARKATAVTPASGSGNVYFRFRVTPQPPLLFPFSSFFSGPAGPLRFPRSSALCAGAARWHYRPAPPLPE